MGVTAAVIAAAGTVAAAGIGAYSSSQKGKGAPSGAYGSKIQPPTFPEFDPKKGAEDYLSSLPMLNAISRNVTRETAKQRESIFPNGAALFKIAGTDLQQMAEGQVPKDVVDKTGRAAAEKFGGSFDPTAPSSFGGGGSQSGTDFARNIGQTSQDQVNRALAVAPTWEQLADSFVYKPQDALNGAMAFLQQRLNWDEAKYVGDMNTAKINASPDPAVAGAYNDQMQQRALSQIGGGGAGGYAQLAAQIPSTIQALYSGYSGVHSAMSGSPMDSGFYATKSGAMKDTGFSNAYNVAGKGWYGGG